VSQFGERLHALDITLFDGIPSQSTGLDRRSLLAAQGAIRARFGSYVYLEIGSHLGGSVQTHVMDPACARIYSIDRRPLAQPDARGQDSDYAGNSTARMIENLTRVAGDGVAKVVTFDTDASAVSPASISPPPHLSFIDGEHTDPAFLSDFSFCRRVMGDRGLVVSHDGLVIYHGIAAALSTLERDGVPFDADASAVPPASISPPPQFSFIDGEHTDPAFLSDFSFCRRVMGDRGLVLCHDGLVIYHGIAAALATLERDGVPFDASPLADAHFAIDLGDTGILRSAELAPIIRESYKAYLFALMANDGYRKFATRPIFKALRSLRDKTRK